MIDYNEIICKAVDTIAQKRIDELFYDILIQKFKDIEERIENVEERIKDLEEG